MNLGLLMTGGLICAVSFTATPGQASQRGASQRSETVQVKDYRISISKVARAREWKDPTLGEHGPVVRAAEGEEILLVTLRIQAAGRVDLKGLSAESLEGKSYRCVFLEIGESRMTTDGKASAATFERVLPFVVPLGTELAKVVLEGVEVPVRRTGRGL